MNDSDGFARGLSDEQRALRIYRWFSPVVLDPALPFVAKEVESQAVVLKVRELKQCRAKLHPLIVFEQTFENRILHPLAMIETGLGDTPEPSFSVGA
jgi:hypothetical protein